MSNTAVRALVIHEKIYTWYAGEDSAVSTTSYTGDTTSRRIAAYPLLLLLLLQLLLLLLLLVVVLLLLLVLLLRSVCVGLLFICCIASVCATWSVGTIYARLRSRAAWCCCHCIISYVYLQASLAT